MAWPNPPPKPPDPPDLRSQSRSLRFPSSRIPQPRFWPLASVLLSDLLPLSGLELCSGKIPDEDLSNCGTSDKLDWFIDDEFFISPVVLTTDNPWPNSDYLWVWPIKPIAQASFHLMFPQVVSYSSISAFPFLDCSENFVVLVALVLWITDSLSLIVNDSGIVSTFVLCMSSLIALVHFVTAVCRFLSVFSSTVIALVSLSMWQVGKSSICSPPVNLVLDFHCPLFSIKEIILLPNTLFQVI